MLAMPCAWASCNQHRITHALWIHFTALNRVYYGSPFGHAASALAIPELRLYTMVSGTISGTLPSLLRHCHHNNLHHHHHNNLLIITIPWGCSMARESERERGSAELSSLNILILITFSSRAPRSACPFPSRASFDILQREPSKLVQ